MNKEIIFVYNLSDPGIAKGELCVHDKILQFKVSNISNPLYDLLKGMVSLINEPAHLWDEQNICWIDWYNKEGGYKWILETDDGINLRIQLDSLPDIFDESTTKNIINTHCNILNFYLAIVEALDKMIKNIGLLNYEQQWQKDGFPLTYFLILKKYLVEHGLWEADKTENSNLNDEIDILLK